MESTKFLFFLRLKYQKNMAPKKSKVKKRVAQPAKGIIERTICAHPMLKRVQKEVRELKKKSAKKHKKIIRYQIVSTYFLHSAFKVLFSALRPVFSRLLV